MFVTIIYYYLYNCKSILITEWSALNNFIEVNVCHLFYRTCVICFRNQYGQQHWICGNANTYTQRAVLAQM